MKSFKEKYEIWKKYLYEDKPDAIYWQLQGMFWNDAVFQIVNATRNGSPIHEGQQVEDNPLIHNMIDEGYVTYQLSFIRRLIDKNPMEGPRAVYSLYRLLDDMKENRAFFNRKNIFDATSLEYDLNEKRKKYEMWRSQQPSGQVLYTPREFIMDREELLHNRIDYLSGVSPKNRTESDYIPASVFEKLLIKLEDPLLVSLKDYVDKYIAHLATPESRQLVKADEIKITLDNIRKAHEILCRTYNFVVENLIFGGATFSLATPVFDLFVNIEKPWIKNDQKQFLQQTWDKNDAEIKSWKSWSDIKKN